MSNWDDLDAALQGVELGEEAGEWAVTAMACVAYADGSADERELAKAREIVTKTAVIRDSLGPSVGEQIFHDRIARLSADPAGELQRTKAELARLASQIQSQEHRDHAFQTLLVIATADHEVQVSEYKLMAELKEMLGTEIMIPMPSINV
jgi:tellurite resistance protein